MQQKASGETMLLQQRWQEENRQSRGARRTPVGSIVAAAVALLLSLLHRPCSAAHDVHATAPVARVTDAEF
jgi:hypothetical protein